VLCFGILLWNVPTVYADTDGSELKVAEPGTLIVQLGTQWAGVEFELRTDDGLYPGTVVVDDTGVLTMELGGSTTYTLSALGSAIAIPAADAEDADEVAGSTAGSDDAAEPEGASESGTEASRDAENESSDTSEATVLGIPVLHLILFIGGLLLCVGCLVALKLSKHRRQNNYHGSEDEYDDED